MESCRVEGLGAAGPVQMAIATVEYVKAPAGVWRGGLLKGKQVNRNG